MHLVAADYHSFAVTWVSMFVVCSYTAMCVAETVKKAWVAPTVPVFQLNHGDSHGIRI